MSTKTVECLLLLDMFFQTFDKCITVKYCKY
nr:MAG TPA: hypothetical protein [Bacteriophage sp.]